MTRGSATKPLFLHSPFRAPFQSGVLLLTLVLGAAGCEWMGFPQWEWHQKLTVEVATPNGPVSASSVIAVRCGSSPKWVPGMGSGGLGCHVRGEAVPVEIVPGQVLFALLIGEGHRDSYLSELALIKFHPDAKKLTSRQILDSLKTLKSKVTITRNPQNPLYPLFVTFDDLTNPKTVQKVDPDNLAARFGPGVSLKRLTLEIVDEPVTEGRIESVLGWLGPHPEPTLGRSPDRFKPIFSATVHHGDFIRR